MTTSWRVSLALAAMIGVGCATTETQKRDEGGGEVLAEGIRRKVAGNEKVTEYDLNGDKKPDVWTYTVSAKTPEGKDIERMARKELDLNWDGKVDISRLYDEREQIVQEALDMDFDGKVDQVNTYEKGIIVRKERDMLGTGKPTTWLFFERGRLVRKEKDTNADGKVDYWEYWEGDQVDRVGEDLDGDGNVDKWTKNPNSES